MPIIPPMSPDTATRMQALLQPALTDLVDLSLLAKMGHWNMQGSIAFVPTHVFMDELVDFARDNYDTVAERIIQLGGYPDARATTVATRSQLKQFEPAPIRPDDVPSVIVPNLQALGRRFQQRCLDAAEDPVTQNIFIDVAQALGKLSWFWQASQG